MKKVFILFYISAICSIIYSQDCIDPSKVNPGLICTAEYNPVCGCNGITYGNACEASRDGILKYTPGSCGADRQAPTVPKGLALNIIQCLVAPCPTGIKWEPSADNIAVVGYYIFLNGTKITSANSISIIVSQTGYYSVAAYDAAGNVSAQSVVLYVEIPCVIGPPKKDMACILVVDPVCGCNGKTYSNGCFAELDGVSNYTRGACGSIDIIAPSIPQNLKNITPIPNCRCDVTNLVVSWDASQDNVKVTGYELYMNGYPIAKTTNLTYEFQGLTPGKTYEVFVVAFDAADNHSSPSKTLIYTPVHYPLLAPSNVKASTITNKSITLNWQENPAGRWFNNTIIRDSGKVVAIVPAKVYTYELKDLAPFSYHDITVGSQDPVTGEITSSFVSIKLTTNSDIIEAENYSSMSGVQTQPTQDIGGGLNVGWIDAGDWMTYKIYIPYTSYYKFNFRIASVNGSTLQMKSGSTDIMFCDVLPFEGSFQFWQNIITIPATQNWQSWKTVTAYVMLSQGLHEFKIFTQQGGFNLNWIQLTTINPGPLAKIVIEQPNYTIRVGNGIIFYATGYDSNNESTYLYPVWSVSGGGALNKSTFTATTPGNYTVTAKDGNISATSTITVLPNISYMIEAENYTYMNNVQKENCSEGGQNVGWIDAGDWMAYHNLNITAGTYYVEYRVASLNGGGKIQLEQAGGSPVLGVIDVPKTNGWQNWTTISQTLTIPQDIANLGIAVPSGGYNINWISLSKVSDLKSGNTFKFNNEAANDDIELYPVPMTNLLNLKVKNGQFSRASVINSEGKIVLIQNINLKASDYQFNVQNLAKGVYLLKLEGEKGIVTRKLLK